MSALARLCTICARGGSKGIPGKNIRPLLGLPLIAYSVKQAKESGLFSAVAVSSDSDEILKVAKEFGADVIIKRPAELSGDGAAKLPAIQHAARETERSLGVAFQTFVDLDCTSPLRSLDDIKNAVALFEANSKATNLITAAPSRRSPYFNLVETTQDGFVQLSKPGAGPVRRQDAPKSFDMNASIYIWKRDSLFQAQELFDKTILYEMPEERSVDIDSELDFKIVELLMKEKKTI